MNTKKERKKTSPIWNVSSQEFKKIVINSKSYKEILSFLNLDHISGGNYKTLKARIEKENIDVEHIIKYRRILMSENFKKINQKQPLEEILVINSTYNRNHLKNRLIKEHIFENKCFECGISEWNGKTLVLQLEHKNGINNDHRLENLCLLCPNCHSQTDTYAGKSNKKFFYCKNTKCNKEITKHSKTGFCLECILNNQKRKVENRPSRTELIELILNKPFLQIGKDFGVSDNAVRKWCKSENLPYRKKDIEEMRSELEKEIHRNEI